MSPIGIPGSMPPHGDYGRYVNHGCRCDKCRDANRAYMMAYRRKKGVRPLAQYHAETTRHGLTRYRKGCRCDVCRAASAKQKREQRARNPEYAARDNAKRRTRRRA